MKGANRGRRGLSAALVTTVTAVLCLGVGGAQAATVQVGSPLNGTFNPTGFGGDLLTLVQKTLPEPGTNVTSPVDGTVVSYKVAAANGTFAIQIVRFTGDAGQSVASSAATPINSTGTSAAINTSLAIRAGDAVGIRNFNGSDTLGAIANGSLYAFWSPALTDGAPARTPDGIDGPFEIGMQATVRYCQVPKLKGKSVKAARKALAAADCTVGKVKKTKKVRNKKKVLSQSVKSGTAISDTVPVNLKVSRVQK